MKPRISASGVALAILATTAAAQNAQQNPAFAAPQAPAQFQNQQGTLPGLAATVGARRVLVVDLMAPTEDLVDIPRTEHLDSEAEGLRQRLAFDPAETTAATVLAAIGTKAEVRDLSIEEPDIEDVVRRIYLSQR